MDALAGPDELPPASLHGKPVHRYDALLACADPAPAAHPNAGVLCFTTSGTTSKPKFVLHDQKTLLRHGAMVAQHMMLKVARAQVEPDHPVPQGADRLRAIGMGLATREHPIMAEEEAL